MKFFRNPRAKTTVGDWSKLILLVDHLKQKGALQTTDVGVFYIYKDLFYGSSPENLAKNLYIYARSAGLIKKGDTLYFREPKEFFLHGQYEPKKGFIRKT